MKASIHVNQKEALKAGHDEYGKIVISFGPTELTQEERDELTKSKINKQDEIETNYNLPWEQNISGYIETNIPAVCQANITTLQAIIQHRIRLRVEVTKKQETEKKEYDAKKHAARAAAIAVIKKMEYKEICSKYDLRKDHNNVHANDTYGELLKTCEVLKDKQRGYLGWKEEINKAKAVAEKQAKAKEQAKAEETDRIAKEKAAQISAWVADHGTENQKKRKELDLLEDDEVINKLREEKFALLAGYKRYEKLNAYDVCKCVERYEDNCDVDFDAYDCKATSEEFDEMQEMQKLVPDAKITIREHEGTSEDCENKVTRKSLHIAIKAGAFNFSREYQI